MEEMELEEFLASYKNISETTVITREGEEIFVFTRDIDELLALLESEKCTEK